jgi:hypothetical protein
MRIDAADQEKSHAREVPRLTRSLVSSIILSLALFHVSSAQAADDPVRLTKPYTGCLSLVDFSRLVMLASQNKDVGTQFLSAMQIEKRCATFPAGRAWVTNTMTWDGQTYECIRPEKSKNCYWTLRTSFAAAVP